MKIKYFKLANCDSFRASWGDNWAYRSDDGIWVQSDYETWSDVKHFKCTSKEANKGAKQTLVDAIKTRNI